jgi:tRNA (guanosine-2'-O-)-methyltransferase
VTGSPVRVRSRADIARQRRSRPHYEAVRLADLPAARFRTIAVLGHEQSGIPPEASEFLDVAAGVPMIGTGAASTSPSPDHSSLYRLAGFL